MILSLRWISSDFNGIHNEIQWNFKQNPKYQSICQCTCDMYRIESFKRISDRDQSAKKAKSAKSMRNMEERKLFLVGDHTKYTFFSARRANNQIKPKIHSMFHSSKYDLLYLSTFFFFLVDSFFIHLFFILSRLLWLYHLSSVIWSCFFHRRSHTELFGSIIYWFFYWWHLFVGFGEYCHTQNKINMGLCLTTWIREWEPKINGTERGRGKRKNIHRVIRIHIMMDIRVKCKRPCYCYDICCFFLGLISRYFGAVSISLFFSLR